VNRLDIFLLALAAVAGLASLAAARGWPGGLWLHRLRVRFAPYVLTYMRRSPATFTYAAILVVTTWVVAGVGPRISLALLRSQSTNLDNLRSHPFDVLFRSMFWSGSTTVLPVIALLALILAPAEVWLGTARLIFVFVVGHVGATLATAVAIDHGYFTSAADKGIDRTIDVGVSYGTFCVAAVLVHRLPQRWRIPFGTALLLVFGLLAFAFARTFTDFGHFVSVLIGFAIYPLVRGKSVAQRARIPLYRPWAAAPGGAQGREADTGAPG
jgi:hypothetical protein